MRLIDADAIPYTMLYKENWLKGTGIEKQGAWKDDIDALPTALHVINCRECRWLKTNEFYTYCPVTKHYGLDSNMYCCWAERKEE